MIWLLALAMFFPATGSCLDAAVTEYMETYEYRIVRPVDGWKALLEEVEPGGHLPLHMNIGQAKHFWTSEQYYVITFFYKGEPVPDNVESIGGHYVDYILPVVREITSNCYEVREDEFPIVLRNAMRIGMPIVHKPEYHVYGDYLKEPDYPVQVYKLRVQWLPHLVITQCPQMITIETNQSKRQRDLPFPDAVNYMESLFAEYEETMCPFLLDKINGRLLELVMRELTPSQGDIVSTFLFNYFTLLDNV